MEKPDVRQLVRGLGLVAAISVNVANMIGTGVFIKARVMTCNVGSPTIVIVVWIVAGLLALAGALTYSELTTMMPRAGSEFVIMREAYGRTWGFLYGWTQLLISRTASEAALAAGFAIFLNDLTGHSLEHTYFTIHLPMGFHVPFGTTKLVAIIAIIFTTAINCVAVKMSGRFSTFLTMLKVALLVFIGAGTFAYAYGHWSNFSLMNSGGTCEGVAVTGGGLAGFGAAMLGALWAYDGWNNLSYVAGEVKRPERNLPLSFIGAMLIVMLLYIFANVGYYHVLTPTEIASVSQNSSVAALASSKFLGAAAISFIAVALMISSFGALHASILGTSRLPYAMARDGLFFESVSQLSPRTHVPIRALVVTGVWSSVLAISGSYDTLTDYAIFAFWMFYGLITASVFVFRFKNPDMPRPYRTWGYPVIPAIFVLVTILLLVNTVMTQRTQSLIGLGMVLLGLPVYWLFLRPRTNP